MGHDELLSRLLSLSEEKNIIVAIDGMCASGKTTLANKIESEIGRENVLLIHADDFFLRPSQRTPERLCEIGGNIDYERLLGEVLKPLKETGQAVYRPYNCQTRKVGDGKVVDLKRITIIEGSYTLRPDLRKFYDISIAIRTSESVQRERILKRDPDKALRFFDEWIPKENEYFKTFGVFDVADIVLNG